MWERSTCSLQYVSVTRESPNVEGQQCEPPVLDVAARAVLGQVWTARNEPPMLDVAVRAVRGQINASSATFDRWQWSLL